MSNALTWDIIISPPLFLIYFSHSITTPANVTLKKISSNILISSKIYLYIFILVHLVELFKEKKLKK